MNTAFRLSVPTGSVDVCSGPSPADVHGLPMSVVPTSNWTVPVAADGETVAVRVTWVPELLGLAGEAVKVVVVARL